MMTGEVWDEEGIDGSPVGGDYKGVMDLPEKITCVDCGQDAYLLSPVPEAGWEFGDIQLGLSHRSMTITETMMQNHQFLLPLPT